MSTAVATEFPARMYINGVWCDAHGGRTLAIINPADESVLAQVAWGGREDAERAIDAAEKAFPEWRASSVYERAKVLKKTAELMRRAEEEGHRFELFAKPLHPEELIAKLRGVQP